MATVATGMPGGICTVAVERVDAVERAARQRHADDRQCRVGGDDAGEVGGHARAADDRGEAVVARPTRRTR